MWSGLARQLLLALAYDHADDPENEEESLGILESALQRVYNSGVVDGAARAQRTIEQLQRDLTRDR